MTGQWQAGIQAGSGMPCSRAKARLNWGSPRPALWQMQGESARRAGDPSHQSEDPPPEGLGGHGPFAQTDPRRPAGQVIRHQSGREWNALQPGQGATELGFPKASAVADAG